MSESIVALLESCPCPRPANDMPEDTTIGQCNDNKCCGCVYSRDLRPSPQQPEAQAGVTEEQIEALLDEHANQIHIREHSHPANLKNESDYWAMHRIRDELRTFARVILAQFSSKEEK